MKIVLKLLLELIVACVVIAIGTWLLQKFAWWVAINHYGEELSYVFAILFGGLIAVWFHHFWLYDGELLYNDKKENKEE